MDNKDDNGWEYLLLILIDNILYTCIKSGK